MNDYKMAAYGTLKVGHGNWHYFLAGVTDVRVGDLLRGYKLRTWQHGGFPAIFKTGDDNDVVVVDVFDLSTSQTIPPDDLVDDIDSMEFGAGYDKEWVQLESGDWVWVYTMDERNSHGMDYIIESGDWNEFTDTTRYA